MKNIKKTVKHTFNNHRYQICLGVCEAPDIPSKIIVLPVNGKTEDDLNTIVHESLHACFYDDLSEREVEQSAGDVARLLWRLGWRKVSEDAFD